MPTRQLRPSDQDLSSQGNGQHPHIGRRPRVTVIGGGTGNYNVLRGLKVYDLDLRVVVAMTDSGGSSGRLRDELGQLPPGDVRQCLIALADEENSLLLRQLFAHRFTTGQGLEGHSVGNLLLAALAEIMGGMDKGIEAASRLLNIQGRVLPVTLSDSHLVATLTDGATVVGESAIDTRLPAPGVRIAHVALSPPALPYGPALDAIRDADLIVLAPGDLYTSLIPNLLVDGVAEAVRQAPGRLALVCNLMTKPSETDGYTASTFVQEIGRYIGRADRVDYLVVNSEPVSEATRARYELAGSSMVELDAEASRPQVGRVIAAPLASCGQYIRHDPQKLGPVLYALALEAMGAIEVQSPTSEESKAASASIRGDGQAS